MPLSWLLLLIILLYFIKTIVELSRKEIKPSNHISIMIINFGIMLFIISAMLNSFSSSEEKVFLNERQVVTTSQGYICKLDNIEIIHSRKNAKVIANVSIQPPTKQTQSKHFAPYFIISNETYNVEKYSDVKMSGLDDLYLEPIDCFFDVDENRVLVAILHIKPYMILVWLGGIIVAVGFVFVRIKN